MPTSALRERRVLTISLVATLLSATGSIVAGLWIGSKSILFDGVYEVVDAGMTALAIVTAGLIARGEDRRFQYGYWHLEPMLALINGIALALACGYALLDGANGLLGGGREVGFGPGAIVAVVSGLWSLAMWIILRRVARDLDSQLVAVDARGWAMGAALSGVLAAGFVIAGRMHAAGHGDWARIVDPAALLLVALALLPFPVTTIRRAGRELLQIAPADLDRRVQEATRAVAAAHGFVDCRSHVARVGRQQFVDIALVAAADAPPVAYARLDRIREDLAAAIGQDGPGTWLSVDFTADARWI
jgi:cation diffusion facilitator family transporter